MLVEQDSPVETRLESRLSASSKNNTASWSRAAAKAALMCLAVSPRYLEMAAL
jgi:hypothetical protein